MINNVECTKTGLKNVLTKNTTITCDQSMGVFPTARGSVTLSPYSIGKYEVTRQLYKAVMGRDPSYHTYSKAPLESSESDIMLRPVEYVDWYEAIVFCNKLSALMGKTRCYKLADGSYPENAGSVPSGWSNNWINTTCDWTADGYRLPTECEWECAARGGKYSTGTPWTYLFSGSNTADDVAWYKEISSNHPWEVGLKAPNRLGLYDMSGNVEEWCWDFSNGISSSTPATGPTTHQDGYDGRRKRGGCFTDSMDEFWIQYHLLEVCYRDDANPYANMKNRGFRLAQSIVE